ncbi:MAG TPA: trypsin-like serine protease [Streptosporangiaceae bacterium]|nr:trypsin-like serine protease [Streptosporangiaceae bacterium]
MRQLRRRSRLTPTAGPHPATDPAAAQPARIAATATVVLTLLYLLIAPAGAFVDPTGAFVDPTGALGDPTGLARSAGIVLSGKATPAANLSVSARSSYAVGALFLGRRGRPGRHFCTASVVASPAGDLVITAAHCMTGKSLSPGRVLFAPGYHRGRFPRGLWVVTRKFVTRHWAAWHDPNDDVAFLTVARKAGRTVPASQPSSAGRVSSAALARSADRTWTSVQQEVGAVRLRVNTALPTHIRAIGYPDASARRVSCSARAVPFRPHALDQIRFVCGGFTDGTSGGPLLSDTRRKGRGQIIGVIGGYELGGNSPDISYSAVFGPNIAALYRQASAAKTRQASAAKT